MVGRAGGPLRQGVPLRQGASRQTGGPQSRLPRRAGRRSRQSAARRRPGSQCSPPSRWPAPHIPGRAGGRPAPLGPPTTRASTPSGRATRGPGAGRVGVGPTGVGGRSARVAGRRGSAAWLARPGSILARCWPAAGLPCAPPWPAHLPALQHALPPPRGKRAAADAVDEHNVQQGGVRCVGADALPCQHLRGGGREAPPGRQVTPAGEAARQDRTQGAGSSGAGQARPG